VHVCIIELPYVMELSRGDGTLGGALLHAPLSRWLAIPRRIRELLPAFARTILTKISKVTRCLRLPRNARGRDFVVGDLHGHLSLFEQELDRLRFDPSCDRVLSVGDLIDRGPESLATLSLIEQPWFHAVLGNHELMLLNFLHCYGSRLHSRKSYPTGGGEWISEAITRNRKTISRLARQVATLPLAIHVEGDVPFNVTHGDMPPVDFLQDDLSRDETICMHKADNITSSRGRIGAALKVDLMSLRFAQHSVQISPTPLAEIPITYAGHSPVRDVTVHNSYVYIDQGVCARTAKRAAPTPPTVLDHRKFAYWLGGVATARGRSGPGSIPQSRIASASAGRLALV
jgi:serine/threonine protein phosphatase 1